MNGDNIHILKSSMTVVERLHRRQNTLTAMLEETAEFLDLIVGVNATEATAAAAQAEAIRELLTADLKRG